MSRPLFFIGYVLAIVALVLLFGAVGKMHAAGELAALRILAVPLAMSGLALVLVAVAIYLPLRDYVRVQRRLALGMASRVSSPPRSAPGR